MIAPRRAAEFRDFTDSSSTWVYIPGTIQKKLDMLQTTLVRFIWFTQLVGLTEGVNGGKLKGHVPEPWVD
ncbi:hypothetical protein HMPREF0290_0349 [Corynebacterium efficiens YS-314]|nr:hypothetical protein HMPREF0290_0349 [Corynebacterium efficiens YS-314]